MKLLILIFTAIAVTGCSLVGKSDVGTAPYTVLKSYDDGKIEVRHYPSMVLVSVSMSSKNGNSAFRNLFNYIGGENQGATKISMTAPVIMGASDSSMKGTKIPMTAPVFMNEEAGSESMSFVMPNDFTVETTPKPTNPDITVSELKNYKVAVITFSGRLSDNNVKKQTDILVDWIDQSGYTAINTPLKAGYNSPFTLPMMRRNEVLIEIN